ncbi:lactoylglutathione lyase-like lyase [Halogeometricum borinquense DSM 11551]|uniref:Lactoylglutathione lyase-like lyase n=2 Tax=Halogeometricum borinquense TaxID=60847 RepID=E4NU69_HALBP|nr:VOC family protein [Halogeometricum borinquense]ADQ68589.1 lactoylglutathione lyase-like lyase [Halogeometricum borinquense DSM 11551]ELY25540.1 lactoylglutathione lyase-like lyase [Halogeometricum borinquense DSM 11551]RYJ08573.1 VOC family protein [Halogeometricum borinquense]
MPSATILHTCLNVADAAEAIEFYKQFGFTESWQFTTPDGRTTNYYVSDGDGVELQLSETDGETDFEMGTGWDHLALGVEDVDQTVERINHYGVEKEPGPQPEAEAYTAFIRDPDGHVVELIEPLD